MKKYSTDVLIVGAGPTGLFLSNLLASHHIKNILIEKNILQNPYSKFFKINSFVEKQGMIFKSENNKFGIKFIYPKSKLYELNEIKI